MGTLSHREWRASPRHGDEIPRAVPVGMPFALIRSLRASVLTARNLGTPGTNEFFGSNLDLGSKSNSLPAFASFAFHISLPGVLLSSLIDPVDRIARIRHYRWTCEYKNFAQNTSQTISAHDVFFFATEKFSARGKPVHSLFKGECRN